MFTLQQKQKSNRFLFIAAKIFSDNKVNVIIIRMAKTFTDIYIKCLL